jgi:glycosyltransferase involved in cell wall biosynthesis
MRFSVIIPTRDRRELLLACLRRLESQTYSDFEIVVVDDGSKDGTSAAVMAETLERVTLVPLPASAGPSAARNAGVAWSRGAYLTFLDSDDEALPDWLKALDAALDAHDPPFATCGMRVIDRASGVATDLLPRSMGAAYNDIPVVVLPGAYAVRRDVFLEAGGFAEDLRYGEHHELFLRLVWDGLDLDRDVAVDGAVRVLKYNDRSVGVERAYAPERGRSAEAHIERHGDRLRRDERLFASYCAVAGVEAARRGEFAAARRYFRLAGGTPRHPRKNDLRRAATYVPLVRERLWQLR